MSNTEQIRQALEELANELDGEATSGAKWNKAQHTCVSVASGLRNIISKLKTESEPPVTADDPFVKLGVMYMKLGSPKLSRTEFVAWCSNWFGPDADESYLAKAVAELLRNPARAAHSAERVPLTEEQIDAVWVEHGLDECDPHGFARAIEAAHNITAPSAGKEGG